MNPVDECLAMKEASSIRRTATEALVGGVGGAVGAGALAAVSMAAHHIYDAVTASRDFRQMLSSPFNADLQEHYRERPREFNSAFSSLRSMNPTFSKDPMIAGTYMRRMMEFSPNAAGSVLVEAIGHLGRMPESPLHEAITTGGREGARTGVAESMKQEAAPTNEGRKLMNDMALKTYESLLRPSSGGAPRPRPKQESPAQYPFMPTSP